MKKIFIITILIIFFINILGLSPITNVFAATTLNVPTITRPTSVDYSNVPITGKVTVEWTSVGKTGENYDYKVINNSTLAEVVKQSNITSTSFTIPYTSLSEGVTYKIWVNANAPGYNSNHCIRYFTVTKPLATPVISQPTSGAVVSKVNSTFKLSWGAVSNATLYYYSVMKNNAGSTIYPSGNTGTSGTSVNLSTNGLEYGGSYTVIVTAQNSTGTLSKPSTAVTFTVAANSLSTPVINATISGPVNKDTGSIAVSWNSVPSATYYYIGMRKVGTASDVWSSNAISSTSYTIKSSDMSSKLDYSTNYYIYVKAHSANLESLESNHLSFTTSIAVDTEKPVVKITSPTSGQTITKGASISISATATDNVGVQKMGLYIDSDGSDESLKKASSSGGSLTYTWDTSDMTVGQHTILVTSWDGFNRGDATVTVTVVATLPTISGFDTTASTMTVGEVFSFAGTILSNGGNLTTVQVEMHGPDDPVISEKTPHFRNESLNNVTYSLSNVPSITTGTGFMTEPGVYWIRIYAKNAGMTEGIKLAEKQITLVDLPLPIISGFDTSPKEINIGELFSFAGTVNAGAGTLDKVSVGIYDANSNRIGGFYKEYSLDNVTTFNLSSIPSLIAGTIMKDSNNGDIDMTKTGVYWIVIYARNSVNTHAIEVKKQITLTQNTNVLPTIDGFDTTPQSVVIGDSISFAGTVNTKIGTLDKVTVAVYGPDSSFAGGHYKEYYLLDKNTTTFSLANVPSLIVGTNMRGYECDIDMTKAGVYQISIYARNSVNTNAIEIKKQITVTKNTKPTILSIEGSLGTNSVILGDKKGLAIATNSLATGVEIQENGVTSINIDFKGSYPLNDEKTFTFSYLGKSIGEKTLRVYAKNGSAINYTQYKDYIISVCNDKIDTPQLKPFNNSIEVNEPLTISWNAPLNTTPDSYSVVVFIEDPFSYQNNDVYHLDNITNTSTTIPAGVFSMSRKYNIYVEAVKKSWVKSERNFSLVTVTDTKTPTVLSVTPNTSVVKSTFIFSLASPLRFQNAFFVFDNPSTGQWLDEDSCRNNSNFKIGSKDYEIVNNKYVFTRPIQINEQGNEANNNYRKVKVVFLDINGNRKESNEVTFAVTPSLQPPSLESLGVTDITSTSATLKGKIVNFGGGTSITKFGFELYEMKTGSPIYTNSYFSNSESIILNADSTFIYTVKNLTPDTQYKFMPCAVNNNGVPNSSQVFMDVTTSKAAEITGNKIKDNPNAKKNQISKQTKTISKYADPIDTSTGAHLLENSYLSQNSMMDLRVTLSYNSLLLEKGTMGYGWSHNFEIKLEKSLDGNIVINWSPNYRNTFINDGNESYKSSDSEDIGSIMQNADGGYTLITQNKTAYSFNSAGVLLKITNKALRNLNFNYSNGYLTKIIDEISGMHIDLTYTNNLVTKFSDGVNSVIISYNNDVVSSITDENGVMQTFTYNADNQVLSSVKGGKNLFTNTYDEFGRVESQDDAVTGNGLTYFSYDDISKPGYIITTITDRNGKVIKMVHDDEYRLVQKADAMDGDTKYSYDNTGKMQNIFDSLDRSIGATYDANGNTSNLRDVAGNPESYVYDDNNNLVSYINSLGQKVRYEYNNKNLITRSIDELGYQTLYSYNDNGQVLTITYPNGGITTNEYDAKGMLTSTIDPTGVKRTFTYDNLGRVLTESNAEGNTTTYVYDKTGNITKATDPMGNTSEFIYDENGNVLSSKAPNGKTTTYEYNGNGKLIKEIDSYGKTIIYTYDGEDRLVTVTDKNGYTTTNIYDANGNIIEKVDQNGNNTKYYYDVANRLISVKDALGNIVLQNKYDAFDNVIQSVNGTGDIDANSYNSIGLMTTSTDGKGDATTFYYDVKNRLIKSADAMNGESSVTFDSQGNILTVSSPIGITVTYSYDKTGRVTSKTTVGGNKVSYKYNNKGQLVTSTNARNQLISSSYNATGRLAMLTLPDGNKIEYSYDVNGNVLTVKDNSGTISRTYDDLNRITSYTDAASNTLAYEYDANSNLTKLTYPDGKVVNYEYDKCNNLIKVTDWSNRVTIYEYDANNRLIKTARPNGTEQTLVYDNASRITDQKDIVKSSGAVVYEATYDYDGNGNIIGEINSVDEIPSILVNSKMTYGKDNLLLTYNGKTVSYDEDGNMIAGPLNGVMSNFTYDSQNRLLTAGNLIYKYDVEGNRIGITDTTNGKTTKFVINTNTSLSQVLVQEESDGTKTYYVYGLGLIGQESKGIYSNYHYDYRGSTIALTNQNAVVTDKISYGLYGEIASKTGSINSAFLYNGRDGVMVDNNSLYYMRARYYNTEIKRFLSMDVLDGGIVDGRSLNKFAYANGQPVNYSDPFGRSPNDSQKKSNSSVNNIVQNAKNAYGTYKEGKEMYSTVKEVINLAKKRDIYSIEDIDSGYIANYADGEIAKSLTNLKSNMPGMNNSEIQQYTKHAQENREANSNVWTWVFGKAAEKSNLGATYNTMQGYGDLSTGYFNYISNNIPR